MNDVLAAQEIAAVLRDSYNIENIHAAQAAADLSRPSLSVTGSFQAYGASFRKGTVAFELRSRLADETEAGEHAAMVEALFTALLGVDEVSRSVAKSLFLQALATRNRILGLDYGTKEVEASVDGDDLRTELTLNFAFKFV